VPNEDLPEPCPAGLGARPWVREVRVAGGASFLRDQSFRLSPDLTCLIGGSMTGKSTFLDGLRLRLVGDSGLPDVRAFPRLREDVEARARGFSAGNAHVEIRSPAGDVSRPVADRFSPRFFGQGELRTLAEDDDGIEHLVFHLVPGRGDALVEQREELEELDGALAASARGLVEARERFAAAEQAFDRANQALEQMALFAEAGAGALPPAQQDQARAALFAQAIAEEAEAAQVLGEGLLSLHPPVFVAEELTAQLDARPTTAGQVEQARTLAGSLVEVLGKLEARAEDIAEAARRRYAQLVRDVQAARVAGGEAEDLSRFEAFAKAAQHYDSFQDVLEKTSGDCAAELARFQGLSKRRLDLVSRHRKAVREVCAEVESASEGRVRVGIDEEGRLTPLEEWVKTLRQKGITRWWNTSPHPGASAFEPVLDALDEEDPARARAEASHLGMTDAVATTLLEQLAPAGRRLQLRALRCPDRFRIQWLEEGVVKDLHDLSGGRRVAVLLSLLLESDDPTPLFIDQPEDELDNRFLNETIIPALHRLKGKRQVVVATHNANIVVNGDADQVIALEADARRGRVDVSGAIEDPAVRDAILRTLDGGEDAFRLRRAKYGF